VSNVIDLRPCIVHVSCIVLAKPHITRTGKEKCFRILLTVGDRFNQYGNKRKQFTAQNAEISDPDFVPHDFIQCNILFSNNCHPGGASHKWKSNATKMLHIKIDDLSLWRDCGEILYKLDFDCNKIQNIKHVMERVREEFSL